MADTNDLLEGDRVDAPELHEVEPDTVKSDVRAALEEVRAKAAPAEGVETPRANRGDGRDAAGKFVGKEGASAAPAAPAAPHAPVAPEGPASPQAAPGPAPGAFQPPPGWAPEAKAAFGSLPPAVQQAVAAREEEVNRGFQVLQNYKGLEKFADFVRSNGTNYHDVFDRATKWEQAIVRDPIGSILHLAQLRGLTPQLLVSALTNPQVRAEIQARNAYGAQRQTQAQQPLTIDAVREAAREEYQRASTEQRVNHEVSSFLSDPRFPHAAAVSETMGRLLEGNWPGVENLEQAYQTALRMHPEIQATAPGINPGQQRQQQAANQARQAAKAVTGAPAGGTPPTARPNEPETLRDALRQALDQQRGRVA